MQAALLKSKSSLLIWASLVLFFAFQFILRLAPGILREDLTIKYSLTTIQFGQLSAFYYLGYASMQIPIGYLLDKYNMKLISCLSIFTTAIGAFIFANAESLEWLLASRLIIGAGSASGFLAVAKATTELFHEKYKNSLIGFAFTFGLMGAVLGGQPAKMLFKIAGFQAGVNILGIICLLIGIVVISTRSSKSRQFLRHTPIKITDLFDTLLSPTVLYIGVCGGLMVGTLEGFGDVWAITYFAQVYGFSESQSINATFSIYIGMCIGGPLLAYCADRTKSSILIIFMTGLLVAGIFMILFILKNPSVYFVSLLMLILGILCSYQVLVFTVASDLFSKDKSALTISIINCINMSFGYLFHVAISYLIQKYWTGELDANNVPIYTREAFEHGIRIIPILCLVGASGFILISQKTKRKDPIAE